MFALRTNTNCSALCRPRETTVLPPNAQVQPIAGTADMCSVAMDIMAGPRFWLAGVLLSPAMSLLPDITHMTFQRTFAPKPFQIYQVRPALRTKGFVSYLFDKRAMRCGEWLAAAAIAVLHCCDRR